MIKSALYIISTFFCGAIVYAAVNTVVFSQELTLKEKLIQYIEINKESAKPVQSNKTGQATKAGETENGNNEKIENVDTQNWRYYLFSDTNKKPEERSYFEAYGGMKQTVVYGKSYFTKSKYKTFDEDEPRSKTLSYGMQQTSEMNIHIEGRSGKRVSLYVDHDSEEETNTYRMQYRAVEEDELIREINAGEIDIKQNRSKYAVFDNSGQKGLGLDINLRKNNFAMRAFGSILKGKTEVENFRGNSTSGYISLSEYQFIRNTYYQLEPFKRFDSLATAPVISTGNNSYTTLVTFTSEPSAPASYRPASVNIDSKNFELYMDDQNSTNNANAVRLTSVDSGYYDKLTMGTDYRINYSTGVITFLVAVKDEARIYATYTMENGSNVSIDPAARTDVVSGKIFVFIKYGTSLEEDVDKDYIQDQDTNNDGRINHDIYELRSVYFLGEKNLKRENLKVQFFQNNSILSNTDVLKVGRYEFNLEEGLISFYLREPFRSLLSQSNQGSIYSETRVVDAFRFSEYKFRTDYYRDARVFNLKHLNILKNSVKVKIDGRKISKSLYTVDHAAGQVEFINDTNPVITNNTQIEIRYEYLPENVSTKRIVGGIRTDYKINNNLSIGGTVLGSRDSKVEIVPEPGAEPTQNIVLEADAEVYFSPKNFGKMASALSGKKIKRLPFDLRTYVEYARSYVKTNTFGKAMLDDMDSTNEIISVSMSDKDWMLSSMPESMLQSDRALLYYYYHRDLDDTDTLLGDDFSGHFVEYSVKPGPFNVAEGHTTQLDDDDQRSLVFDFDFSYGDYASVVTRQLSENAVDLSALQYIELWYKPQSGTGTLSLAIDIGTINEDSDGDGLLDTEDENNNGELDYDPGKNIFEDRGYDFNPSGELTTNIGSGPRLSSSTKGDGKLTSEDLNRNGALDTTEQVITFPGTYAYIPGNLPAEDQLQVNLSDTSWKKARIYLRRSTLNDSQNDLLKKIWALRLYAKNISATTGRLYVDAIKLVSSNWKDIKINDVPEEDPDKFKVTTIDTYSDTEYDQNSFVSEKSSLYLSLYGDRDKSDLANEHEGALEIEYNLASSEIGSTTRKFGKNMDLRHYKTLSLWVNVREQTSGDVARICIGSSENDYYEYEFPLDNLQRWQQIKLKLASGSGGNYSSISKVGNPDFKRIRHMKLKVIGSSGKFWLNNIYLSEPETLKDDAYWCETEMNVKRPFYKTKSGMPIISDFNLKYVNKGYGENYTSPGRTTRDMRETAQELYSSMLVVPKLNTDFSFKYIKNKTDLFNEDVHESLTGQTNRKIVTWETSYDSEASLVPSLIVLYKQENYLNISGEYLDLALLEKETVRRTYSPKIILDQEINHVLAGQIKNHLTLDMMFERQKINKENKSTVSTIAITEEISRTEKEAFQKNELIYSTEYKAEYFFIKPELTLLANEFVAYNGKAEEDKTDIYDEIHGKYHFPFYYNSSEFKFIERSKKIDYKWGSQNIPVVNLEHYVEIEYHENEFQDYDSNQRLAHSEYLRSKNSNSKIENRIHIPVEFKKSKKLSFIKSINFDYKRSVILNEKDVPYEGEENNWNQEEYGAQYAWRGISETGFNFYENPPWYFYLGRKNYANGRDQVYETRNEQISYEDGSTVEDYNNSLQLSDNFTVATTFDFDLLTLNLETSLTQMSERQDLQSIPHQNVIFSSGNDISINLMKIFDFGFFRDNKSGLSYHASFLNLGYTYTRNMFITLNQYEDIHNPSAGINFKWDNSSIYIEGGVEFRHKKNKQYISEDDSERSPSDDKYFENMPQVKVNEWDKGYTFGTGYETQVEWVYNLFSNLYKLADYPVFKISYDLEINRYDYSYSVSPDPYDQHLLTVEFLMDLHQNVRGGLMARGALERFYNRDTGGIYREIMSYEVGFNFEIHF